MLPLLRFAADQKEHRKADAVQAIAEAFHLSEEERNTYLESGQEAIISNRVGWALMHLRKAGLLQTMRRGVFQISDTGNKVLAENPTSLNVKFLMQFSGYASYVRELRDTKDEISDLDPLKPINQNQTPYEIFDTAYARLRAELASELLITLKGVDPSRFERIVVELLVKMGYGGSLKDAGRATGRSGDEGIDGVIKEDHLGLDNIYIQAKRWEAVIGRPEIQKFAGALQGQRARKGIFITTSDFTQEAKDYIARIDSKIVLINGDTLSNLMMDFGIGVTNVTSYEIKKIDADYFADS
jgi:restriction system protein